jgi:catechol 2,3-dioxygenase-like lactoylglutathione lyase family enzyme
MLTRLDHILLAIPPGSEDRCRPFYVGVLGMTEQRKPDALAARGGLWLRSGTVEIHLGVEKDFRAAKKAHPALRVSDIDALAEAMTGAGYQPVWDDDIEDIRRFFVFDPVGNRLEFIAEERSAADG